MAFDLSLLGSKLKRYREQFQVSINEVALATGIPEQTLSALENGQQRPTGDEILILADYYMCDYKFFISNDRVAPFEQTEELFRRHGDEFRKEDRWRVQEFLFLCECEEFLLESLHVPHRAPFSFKKRGTYYKRHAWDAAAALRQHLGHSIHNVGPALDVYRDFRGIGLHVFRRELANSNISGLFIRHPTADKCVLVNYSEDVYRQRFTAAHEAAHTILDDDQDFVVSFTGSSKELSEIRANNFASHYLMPPKFLETIPNVGQWNEDKTIEWANKLQVSTQALANALADAKLISDEIQQRITAVRVPPGMKGDPELPQDLSPRSRERRQALLRRGLSSFYVQLCFEAYDRHLISVGRVAEMLCVDEPELAEIARLFGRNLGYERD